MAKPKDFTKPIKNLTKGLNKIQKILKCPVNIISNFNKCGWFYTLDIIIWILHWIPFFISLTTVFIPAQIIFWLIVLMNRGNLKYNFLKKVMSKNILLKKWYILDIDTFTVTQKRFATLIETIYYYLSGGKRLLNRSSSDISKCYCMPPIKLIFNPLTGFKPFSLSKFSTMNMPFMSLIILSIIFIPAFITSTKTNKV